jgi:hypothetical protein
MVGLWVRRVGMLLVALGALSPLLLAADRAKVEYFKGKVVPLAELVERDGSKLDADAGPNSLVLAGDDGKVYFLVKDNGSRLFYKDPTLLHKPMRLTGRLLPGSQLLRVFAVHSLIKDQLHEVYYWCDVCTIRRGEKNICECCGGPMELRQEPLPR